MIRSVFQKDPVSSSAGKLGGSGELEAGMLVRELMPEIKGPGIRRDGALQFTGCTHARYLI